MTAHLPHVPPAPHENPVEELSVVALTRSVTTEDGILPAESHGTVVSVYDKGALYCVEFIAPFNVLVDLKPSQIRALPGASRDRIIAGAYASGDRS